MKIIDKLAQLKIKRELKKWGLDEAKLNIDLSGISAKDLVKMKKQFQALVKKHPLLEKIKLDSLPALLKHRGEIRKIFEQNKDEFQELLKEIKKDK